MTPPVKPDFLLRAIKNNANPQLLGSIGAGDTAIALKSGHGAKLPQPRSGAASSTGNAQTLNDTGDLGTLAVGDFVENVTDGSHAIVLSISGAPDSVKTTPLYGGSDNLWQSGDTWAKDRAVLTFAHLDANGEIDTYERVLMTARSTDTITVTRGYDSDTPITFAADDYAFLFVEKDVLEEMQKAIKHMYMRIHESYLNTDRYVEASGTTGNAYAVTLTPAITDYADIVGMPINIKSDITTSGACTVNINGLGAKNVKKETGAIATESGDIATGQVFQVIYDGTNFQLQTYMNNNALTPIGSMLLWTTDTAPSGFLLCYGQAISRTTYSALFAVVSTTFGVGDGSTTFNLPDMRGRVPLGQDDMGGASANRVTNAQADSLGGNAGAETHTLVISEMPAHTHDVPYQASSSGATKLTPSSNNNTSYIGTTSTGGDGAHNNMQPYITLNYIIKT